MPWSRSRRASWTSRASPRPGRSRHSVTPGWRSPASWSAPLGPQQAEPDARGGGAIAGRIPRSEDHAVAAGPQFALAADSTLEAHAVLSAVGVHCERPAHPHIAHAPPSIGVAARLPPTAPPDPPSNGPSLEAEGHASGLREREADDGPGTDD